MCSKAETNLNLYILQVETKDALLHAINEEFVEAVEVLLEHEETIHLEGTPHVSARMIKFAKYLAILLEIDFRVGRQFHQTLPISPLTSPH